MFFYPDKDLIIRNVRYKLEIFFCFSDLKYLMSINFYENSLNDQMSDWLDIPIIDNVICFDKALKNIKYSDKDISSDVLCNQIFKNTCYFYLNKYNNLKAFL
jgi:hypothetical protein